MWQTLQSNRRRKIDIYYFKQNSFFFCKYVKQVAVIEA